MERQDAREGKEEPELRARQRRLLVVDEDLDDLRYYSSLLQRQGYQVRSIPSYADGTRCLERENFDFIMVSQGGPSFEGRRVLARAIEKDRHTPVLVITRSANIPCYIEAIQLGALDYVEKPLVPAKVRDLVAKHLRPQRRQA